MPVKVEQCALHIRETDCVPTGPPLRISKDGGLVVCQAVLHCWVPSICTLEKQTVSKLSVHDGEAHSRRMGMTCFARVFLRENVMRQALLHYWVPQHCMIKQQIVHDVVK